MPAGLRTRLTSALHTVLARLPRAPLLVVGVFLGLFGSVGATLVGPDDTLMLGEMQESGAAAGLPVVTDPAITAFQDLDLVVRVRTQGETFLGASHRVDADDLLDGVRHFKISRLALNEVGGYVVKGRPTRLRPGRITGWRASTTGEGTQELVVPLTGEPVAVVAVPLEEDGSVSMAFGASVHRLWLSLVVTACGGLLLLLAWWLLGRWRRRHDGRPPRRPREPDFVAVRTPPKESLRLGFVVPGVAAALLLSGCGGVPSQVSTGSSGLAGSRVALAPDEAEEAVEHYAVRRVRAARRARKGGDFDAWEVAETGPLLEATVVSWEQRQLEGRRLPRPGREVTAHEVYSPSFEDYPMWTAVVLQEGEGRRLVVLTRSRFARPWLGTAAVGLGRQELPEPLSRTIPAGRQAEAAAAAALERVRTFWETGRAPGLRVDRRTKRARGRLAGEGATIAVSEWFQPVHSQRVVEVTGGHLVISVQSLQAAERHVLTTALIVPAQGRPRVLGSTLARSFN